MQEHHERAMWLAVKRLNAEPDTRMILLGGSIAKGIERPDSDVDLLVIVPDDCYADRLSRTAATFFWTDIADWPNGYVEGKYLSRSYVLEAAERGSEPTRWSFMKARQLWGAAPDLEACLPRIPVYPEADRERRIDAFLSQFALSRIYFWPEGVRRRDPYLKAWAAVQAVLFAGRTVLAYDRILFPNQKRLMEAVATCPSKPAGFEALAEQTLGGDEGARDELWEAVTALVGTRSIEFIGSRFEQDTSMSWFTRSHDVAEW